MANLPHAVHRTILVVDVEGFGSRHRTNRCQVVVRDGLYRAIRRAFSRAGIPWDACDHEDRGDGVFILAPPELPKSAFAESVPRELVAALREHNTTHPADERIRLRMVLHAGEVTYDNHGKTAAAITLAFRLLDSEPVKSALADSPGLLALITSSWFFDEVVRHSTASDPATYRPVRVIVKETTATGWISLPDHPYPPRTLPAPTENEISPTPHQLPAYTRYFVGRDDELDQVSSMLDSSHDNATVLITAINGSAGIGKTTFALHWAHRVANRFPDGELFVNLRGFDPTDTPMHPGEAIRGFLDAFGIPPGRIPLTLDAQAALYRSLLANRRMLLVLDNARDAEQVRPLLPASPTCFVMITSRNQLASLTAWEDIRTVSLDVLSLQESTKLLTVRLGHNRVAAEPEIVTELIDRCARLPLALAILAARANSHPSFPLRLLAEELAEENNLLNALDAGDLHTDVRAVFSWSCRAITPPPARMFRLLGLHPGPDLGVHAAASLTGTSPSNARAMLGELTRAHLINEYSPGRFRLHDLLRTYAAERAIEQDTEGERQAAVRRMLDHYLHTACAAHRRLAEYRRPITVDTPGPGVALAEITDHRQAIDWLTTEHANLLAAIDHAATHQLHTYAWQLPWALEEFYRTRGHRRDWVVTQEAALTAAGHLADRAAQACAHRSLGRVYRQLGRYGDAHIQIQHAIARYREVGDRIGEASSYRDFSWLAAHQRQHSEGLSRARHGLHLARATGNRFGEALSLRDLGHQHALADDYQHALDYCSQSLDLCRELGSHYGEAQALDSIGFVYRGLGDYTSATMYYHQALELHRDRSDCYFEAQTLDHLGDVYLAAGEHSAARRTWRHCLDILDQLGHPDADGIRLKLTHK